MERKTMISIIVPVYNAEDTIRNCLDSILAQTLFDFEVILIDDGSPDYCGRICDEYAKKDIRFKVIHKSNEGVSAARQVGIDNAKGEYTIHIDPDDWVEPSMLEKLYAKAKETDADIVICDFYENILSKQIYHKQRPSSLDHNTVLCELFQQLHGSCCNKLIKRACYNMFDVRFPVGIYYCEDLYVVSSILRNNVKVAYLPQAFYHYVQYNDKPTMIRYYDEKTYEHDLHLKDMFYKLMEDKQSIVDILLLYFDASSIFRAFENGYSYYTSSLFKQRFAHLLPLVKQRYSGSLRLFLILSCHGFYRPVRRIKYWLEQVKRCSYLYNFRIRYVNKMAYEKNTNNHKTFVIL